VSAGEAVTPPKDPPAPAGARERLVAELRQHALVIGQVTLTSGARAEYYVDAKRALLRPPAFLALSELVAATARELGATAVGGMTMGADPVACAALASGADLRPSSCGRSARCTGSSAGSRDPSLLLASAASWSRTS